MVKIENWNGHKIRFVEHEGEWWAVANDISTALDYSSTGAMNKIITKKNKTIINPKTLGNAGLFQLGITQEDVKRMSLISELGIYQAIFGSQKPEAKEFQDWVYNMLKELRKATGLEGFQVFRMLDKEHQREAMATLQQALGNPPKVNYIKANSIANKAVSNLFGYEKSVKKEKMTPEMLVKRQSVLDDTVELMTVKEKFGLNLSVSEQIYNKYHN